MINVVVYRRIYPYLQAQVRQLYQSARPVSVAGRRQRCRLSCPVHAVVSPGCPALRAAPHRLHEVPAVQPGPVLRPRAVDDRCPPPSPAEMICQLQVTGHSHSHTGITWWHITGRPITWKTWKKSDKFDIGQGKVREIVVCPWCATTVAIVTK